MSDAPEVWILGAAGRSGRAVAMELAARHLIPVLVGRDEGRLRAVAEGLDAPARIVVASSIEGIVAELGRAHPAVVVNTIGPFAGTALPIVRACAPGTHYVDLSNELYSVTDLLSLHEEAVAGGRSLVTGAGFGVLGTESVVLKLCEGRPPAEEVRVEAVPRIDGSEALGPTLAATVVEGLALGGRRYESGRLVHASVGSDVERLTTPDGATVSTGLAPSGDLEAARRASRAPFVVSASSEAPTRPVGRLLVGLLGWLMSWSWLRRAMRTRLARFKLGPPATPRAFSWTHARVRWADGTEREGWLRAPEGMEFTAKIASEVAARLARGLGRPGAYTPGALFGPELVLAAGAAFVLEPTTT